MADWSHPVLSDGYSDVLTTYLNARDVDSLTLQKSASSNPPDGAFRYDRALDKFQEYNLAGTAYVDKVLSIAGGGTGGATASAARTALGLGSIATQNNNAVNITGGSISGVTMDASVITSGTLPLNRGGTGASLSLGANGTVLQSNGSGIVFGTSGAALTGLVAANLTGQVSLANGGTGANLTLGTTGKFLQSNGAAVVFGVDGSKLTGIVGSTITGVTDGTALTGIDGSAITTGTISALRLPSFVTPGVFQTINTFSATATALTGSYGAITGLGVNITPASSAHFIRIQATINIFIQSNGSGNCSASFEILRGGSLIKEFKSVILTSDANGIIAQIAIDFVDNPASTSTLTYTISGKSVGAVNSAAVNSAISGASGTSTITVQEIL